MNRPGFLDYYRARKIIPTRQDLSDLTPHFNRRRALYLQLGLAPALLRGRSVLEFGPGPGDNALFTASAKPDSYVFVDGNETSLAHIREKEAAGAFDGIKVEMHLTDFLGFQDNRKFDVVLAEGCIHGQENPGECLDHIAGFTAPGGVLVTTMQSFASVFPEICRRMVKPLFARRHPDFNDQVAALVAFFQPDLASLNGMSRLHEDWVMDQILHPYRKFTFTIAEAIDLLGDRFDFFGSSPRFLSDWRWYKSMDGEDPGINARAREIYHANQAALLDYRVSPDNLGTCDGEKLEHLCAEAFDLHLDIWDNDDVGELPRFCEKTEEIAAVVASASPETARSLRDFVTGITALANDNGDSDFGTFRQLFGRGLQFASFVRRDETNGGAE